LTIADLATVLNSELGLTALDWSSVPEANRTPWRQTQIPEQANRQSAIESPQSFGCQTSGYCGTRRGLLPLLPSGPGGVHKHPSHSARSLTYGLAAGPAFCNSNGSMAFARASRNVSSTAIWPGRSRSPRHSRTVARHRDTEPRPRSPAAQRRYADSHSSLGYIVNSGL
jgi:hypothetical protein